VDGKPRTLDYPLESQTFTGRYLADMLVARMDLAVVRKLLPTVLQYRDESGAAARDGAPVIYAFGYQRAVEPAGDWFELNYAECLLGVPGCSLTYPDPGSYSAPFLYVPRLYLNQLAPTILGWLAGYAKHWVKMETDQAPPDSDAAQSFENAPSRVYIGSEILHAPFEPTPPVLEARFQTAPGAGWQALTSVPQSGQLVELLNQPICGIMPIVHTPAYSELAFDVATAEAMALTANVNLMNPFVPLSPKGEFSWPTGAAHDGLAPQAAFRVRTNWKLAGTFDRTKLVLR
jgi:hypothetical protein